MVSLCWPIRWGTKAQGTHCREGEAGHNVFLGGKMGDTSKSQTISTKLQKIAEQASSHPEMVFTTLAHLIDVDFLREVYNRTRKNAAAGVDGVTAAEYGANLEENLRDLHERMRRGRYIAPPVKRTWLDKDGSGKRPIGEPTFTKFIHKFQEFNVGDPLRDPRLTHPSARPSGAPARARWRTR